MGIIIAVLVIGGGAYYVGVSMSKTSQPEETNTTIIATTSGESVDSGNVAPQTKISPAKQFLVDMQKDLGLENQNIIAESSMVLDPKNTQVNISLEGYSIPALEDKDYYKYMEAKGVKNYWSAEAMTANLQYQTDGSIVCTIYFHIDNPDSVFCADLNQ